jgi:hypothetical protein
MKKILLIASLSLVNILGMNNAQASDEVFTWTCSEGRQFKTTGSVESIKLTWESRTYELDRQSSLPGSLRYKNSSTGHDLVVLGNKAMLFNIKTGTRLADFCQTAEMKAGKLPHLFADAEPFK